MHPVRGTRQVVARQHAPQVVSDRAAAEHASYSVVLRDVPRRGSVDPHNNETLAPITSAGRALLPALLEVPAIPCRDRELLFDAELAGRRFVRENGRERTAHHADMVVSGLAAEGFVRALDPAVQGDVDERVVVDLV